MRTSMLNHQLSFAPLISHNHNMPVNSTVIAATSPIVDGVQVHTREETTASKDILSVKSKQTCLPLFPVVLRGKMGSNCL